MTNSSPNDRSEINPIGPTDTTAEIIEASDETENNSD